MALSVHLVTSAEELETLQFDWNVLHARSLSPTIFLSWEWMVSWLEAVYPEAQLFILLIRDAGNTLVAVAPFYRTGFTLLAGHCYKTLRCIGDCHAGAEYPDIIVQKGYEEAACKEIAAFLRHKDDVWDWAWFPNIATWTGAGDRLRSCFSADKLSFCHLREKDFSTMLLPGSWDEYMGGFSRQRRSLLRRQQRKAAQKYDLQITVCSNRHQLDTFLHQLFRLHKKRWLLRGHEGAFVKAPPMKAFHQKMALRALDKGWLAFFSLTAGDRVVAIQYGYVYDAVFSQVQEGFDPDGPAGTGNILRMYVIRWCIEHRIREYDFLGGFGKHKAQWQAKKRIGHELFVGKKCLRNLLFSHLPFWPTGRYINQGRPAVIPTMNNK